MKVDIKEITGNWTAGYALDKHKISSEFVGYYESGRPRFNTIRTDAGEAVFQLKYRSSWQQVEPLAQAVVDHIVPHFSKIGLVVPVPASNVRARQPVYEIAQSVAEKLGKDSFEDIVTKVASEDATIPLKDMSTKEEKVAALEGRFELNETITNEGCWNALVVDDLYDSGASLEAVCAVLGSYSKIGSIFVATLTWK